MASTDSHIRIKDKFEFAATLSHAGIIWGLMLTAAFMTSPVMGLAMIGTMLLLWIRSWLN